MFGSTPAIVLTLVAQQPDSVQDHREPKEPPATPGGVEPYIVISPFPWAPTNLPSPSPTPYRGILWKNDPALGAVFSRNGQALYLFDAVRFTLPPRDMPTTVVASPAVPSGKPAQMGQDGKPSPNGGITDVAWDEFVTFFNGLVGEKIDGKLKTMAREHVVSELARRGLKRIAEHLSSNPEKADAMVDILVNVGTSPARLNLAWNAVFDPATTVTQSEEDAGNLRFAREQQLMGELNSALKQLEEKTTQQLGNPSLPAKEKQALELKLKVIASIQRNLENYRRARRNEPPLLPIPIPPLR